MRIALASLITVLICACAASGYKEFYQPYADAQTIPQAEILQEGQEPQIISTDNIDRDVALLRSRMFYILGVSSFNGGIENLKNAKAQAKKIGATTVLTTSQFTNTRTIQSALVLPDNKTTYSSGTVNADTQYYGATSGYLGSGSTNATYSGTTTTYGSKVVPYTTQQRRYDQSAVFLVKSNLKLKFGLFLDDLPPEMRSQLQRNTGAIVQLVAEDSPAFYANILPGDVLIALDGVPIRNMEHAGQLMGATDIAGMSPIISAIRNGKEISFLIEF